jgi:tRNA U34 5-methylaminomethyl-2-thiouridine-forming methyltransferase MnmC
MPVNVLDDARAGYSYRHAASGEWAHPRRPGPLEDGFRRYADPAWEVLEPRVRAAPDGPLGADRPWTVLTIGFGRGFESVAFLRRWREAPVPARLRLLGLEPWPEALRPWPPRWPEFEPDEAPWWGGPMGRWSTAGERIRVEVLAQDAAAWLAAAPHASVDAVLLDLFSPRNAPDDWQPGLWPGLAHAAAPSCCLTTYCCARSLRSGLESAGAAVEILRKPGQRDGLRAVWPPAWQP